MLTGIYLNNDFSYEESNFYTKIVVGYIMIFNKMQAILQSSILRGTFYVKLTNIYQFIKNTNN
jgi:hypothetical protein